MRNLAAEKISRQRQMRNREYLLYGTIIAGGVCFSMFELLKPLWH